MDGVSPEFTAWFLGLLVIPKSGRELRTELTSSESSIRTIAEAWIPKLVASEVIHEGTEESALRCLSGFLDFGEEVTKKPCKHLVLGISGSSSSTMATDVALELLSDFTESIDVIVTRSARKFINTYPLEIHGVPIWREMYEKKPGVSVPHMKLARETDLVVVLPASARTIARTANGECSDLLSMVITCTRAPVVFFPSMNPRILTSPPVARNIAQLVRDGRYVVYPAPTLSTSDAHLSTPPISQGAVGVSTKQPGNVAALLNQFLKKGLK